MENIDEGPENPEKRIEIMLIIVRNNKKKTKIIIIY
jgi:hypothetical protein